MEITTHRTRENNKGHIPDPKEMEEINPGPIIEEVGVCKTRIKIRINLFNVFAAKRRDTKYSIAQPSKNISTYVRSQAILLVISLRGARIILGKTTTTR